MLAPEAASKSGEERDLVTICPAPSLQRAPPLALDSIFHTWPTVTAAQPAVTLNHSGLAAVFLIPHVKTQNTCWIHQNFGVCSWTNVLRFWRLVHLGFSQLHSVFNLWPLNHLWSSSTFELPWCRDVRYYLFPISNMPILSLKFRFRYQPVPI